jgi:hypothetical protein
MCPHRPCQGSTVTDAYFAAVEALIMAAEGRGPLMHARIGLLRAMNHGRERAYSDRKETHWGQAEAQEG